MDTLVLGRSRTLSNGVPTPSGTLPECRPLVLPTCAPAIMTTIPDCRLIALSARSPSPTGNILDSWSLGLFSCGQHLAPQPGNKRPTDTGLHGKNDEEYRVIPVQKKPTKMLLRLLNRVYKRVTKRLVYEDDCKDISLSTTRVRQRLCDLMGTDVIRLNDKRYFEKLSQRLQEEYETVMDKQEEQRSAAEKQRMRRLMLEGILDNQDDYRAVLHGEHKHRPKKKKKKTLRKNTAGNEGQRSNSPQHSDEDRKKEVETQIEVLSRPSSGTQPEARTSDHSRAPGGKSKHGTGGQRGSRQNGHDTSVKHKNEMYVRPPHHDHARSSTACSTHRKSRRVQSASARLGDRDNSPDSDDSDTATDDSRYETMSLPPSSQRYSKFSRHEPERVRELRSTETVAGLYSIAEELVTVGAANETPTRKVSFKGK